MNWVQALETLKQVDWHVINPLYSISGFIVGVLVGFTGVGGGSLMTPLLVLLFGIAPGTAVGTDLLYAAITKASGTLVHGLNRTVDWRIVRRLAGGSIPATGLTLLFLNYIGASQHGASGLITTVLGIALILTAITLNFRKWLLSRLAAYVEGLSDGQTRLLTNLFGAFLGVLVSISSVGAGAIGVTVLILLYPNILSARIVGSDIAHAVPLTLIAGIGHWFLGSIDWALLMSLLIGSVPGIMIASRLAAFVPERVLRPVLAGALAVVGAKLSI
ncbi:sulfite exporter TauE/SafE family protein [Methylocapsa aurea]|uniref:sulfite exporter TauE/SafE family protein n=1 Tax=Methylocapsa aurea TaxID=663610 RepID=UPI0006896833|nr:sulfite exporter TauE/SafE family protein [Methylocapsa aurea]